MGFFILMFQLIHNHQIEVLNERVTVKKVLPAEPCVRAECILSVCGYWYITDTHYNPNLIFSINFSVVFKVIFISKQILNSHKY
jgi:hypothetical protein